MNGSLNRSVLHILQTNRHMIIVSGKRFHDAGTITEMHMDGQSLLSPESPLKGGTFRGLCSGEGSCCNRTQHEGQSIRSGASEGFIGDRALT